MHKSSWEHMADLVRRYLNPETPLTVLDSGSQDINGTYKRLFDYSKWRYVGIDVAPGPNVDVVLSSSYRWRLATDSADLIISGQTFEHIEFFWLTWLEMVRVLKPGGLIFLIAPSRGPEHRYPVDCWRFYPDGFCALAKYGGLDLLEVHTDWEPHPEPDSAAWGDTVGVFRKPDLNLLRRLRRRLMYPLRQFVLSRYV